MIDRIKETLSDLLAKKSRWIPILIGTIVIFILLLIWPAFVIGMAVGVAGTMIYKTYYQGQNTLKDSQNTRKVHLA